MYVKNPGNKVHIQTIMSNQKLTQHLGMYLVVVCVSMCDSIKQQKGYFK